MCFLKILIVILITCVWESMCTCVSTIEVQKRVPDPLKPELWASGCGWWQPMVVGDANQSRSSARAARALNGRAFSLALKRAPLKDKLKVSKISEYPWVAKLGKWGDQQHSGRKCLHFWDMILLHFIFPFLSPNSPMYPSPLSVKFTASFFTN